MKQGGYLDYNMQQEKEKGNILVKFLLTGQETPYYHTNTIANTRTTLHVHLQGWILWQTDNKEEKEPKSGNYKKFELFPESGKKHENMRMFAEQAPSMISIQWFFFFLI